MLTAMVTTGMTMAATLTALTTTDMITRTSMITGTGTITVMRMVRGVATITATMADPAPPALLCWLSPSFPTGAYAYSHGLEWAVEAGDIRDDVTLRSWLVELLRDGVGRNDAILLAQAHRAARAGDIARLQEVNDLALALAPAAELRLETSQQGRSFLDVVSDAWPADRLREHAARFDEVALPVALALAAACHDLPLATTARAYLTSLVQNLVSAALRLAPIGQSAGQRVIAGLMPEILAVAAEALTLDLDDVGGATFRADLGSLRHETQYTRLFRS